MRKIFYLFFLLIFLISCKKTDDVYYNFTDDDLGWLYFTQKTSDRQSYTLKYLVNNIDTLTVNVITALDFTHQERRISLKGLHSRYHEYFESGGTYYEYNNNSFIRGADVEIEKTKEGICIEKIYVDCGIYYCEQLCSQGNFIPQMVIDTATVNNKTYSEVYKFYPDNETIKVVYFAKNYGFIKIEKDNGDKAELIANH